MKRKILVIEDSKSEREILKLELEKREYDVETAENGRKGLERLLQGNLPIVVALDLKMPEMDGEKMIKKYMEDTKKLDLPFGVAVYTGTYSREDAHSRMIQSLMSTLSKTETKIRFYSKKDTAPEDLAFEIGRMIKIMDREFYNENLVTLARYVEGAFDHDCQGNIGQSGIIGQLRIIKHYLDENEVDKVNEWIKKANKTAKEASHLLDVSRKYRYFTWKMYPDEFKLYEVIFDASKFGFGVEKNVVLGGIDKEDLKIFSSIPLSDWTEIKGDYHLAVGGLMNLFLNSQDWKKPGQRLELTLDLQKISKSEMCLTIRDNGQGMDQETLASLYDPYFTKKKEGVGLGMVVVQQMIENLNGRIETESAPNVGTTHKLYFPLIK